MIRRLRFDVVAAYLARIALTLVGVVMWPLPRRDKVTMVTRQSNRPSSDFAMLAEAIRDRDSSIDVVTIARMVPSGLVPKVRYCAHLVREMYHVETSRLLIVDGYSIVASAARHSRGLTVVQTWHALGALKKFGLSILGRAGGRDPLLARAMRMHAGYDLVIASAERSRAPFAEALGVSLDKVIVAPLPRVDRLRDPEERARARATFDGLYPELAAERIALFAPTFRVGQHAQDAQATKVTEALATVGYATITKLHPIVPVPQDDGLRVAPGMSTQEMLLVADIFVTDYSSAVFEAAVAGVPSYLYAPDLDRYVENRDFYMSYPDDLCLPMARSADELAQHVSERACGAGDISEVARRHVVIPEQGTAAPGLAAVVSERAFPRNRRGMEAQT